MQLGETNREQRTTMSTSHKSGAKAATGKSYKALRKLIDEQCGDRYLTHCNMTRERARDGTIEWVPAETKERFIAEGKHCLIWNTLSPSKEGFDA